MSANTISTIPKTGETASPTTTSSSGGLSGIDLLLRQDNKQIIVQVNQTNINGGEQPPSSNQTKTGDSSPSTTSQTTANSSSSSDFSNVSPHNSPDAPRDNGNHFGHTQSNGNHFGHTQRNGSQSGHTQGNGNQFGHTQGNGNQFGHNKGVGTPAEGSSTQTPAYSNSNSGVNPATTSPTNSFQNTFQNTLHNPSSQNTSVANQSFNNQQTHGEQAQNNQLIFVVRTVLRDSGIHLNRNVLNNLIFEPINQNPPKNSHGNQAIISQELKNLVQNITHQATSLLNSAPNFDNRAGRQMATEILRNLQVNLSETHAHITQNTILETKNFGQMQITERMLTAAQFLKLNLPDEHTAALSKNQPNDILSGLLLSRGLLVGKENTSDLRNLATFQPPLLPREMTLSQLRDLGRLVTILIADAVSAKTPVNLELAVNKFIKLLISKNEFGVLTAAVNLVLQIRDMQGVMSRPLQIVQIYRMMEQLVILGEKAMLSAASTAESQKHLQSSLIALPANPLENEDSFNPKHINFGAEATTLRQFLEFNPSAAFDRSVSRFDNPEQESAARNAMIDICNADIERWLRSGDHRFVKEVDFDKPLGVMADRNGGDTVNVSKVRFVLVRDSSPVGWHFLKSSLVG